MANRGTEDVPEKGELYSSLAYTFSMCILFYVPYFIAFGGLFYDDVSGKTYIALNGRKIDEQWTGKDLEGIRSGLIKELTQH